MTPVQIGHWDVIACRGLLLMDRAVFPYVVEMIRSFSPILLLVVSMFITACQSSQNKAFDPGVPLTLQSIGPTYADYAIEVADSDKNETLTQVEWISAGGTQRSFELLDENRDAVISRSELIRMGSNSRFLDFTRRYVDVNNDNRLTPQEFRSPAGVRLMRLDF